MFLQQSCVRKMKLNNIPHGEIASELEIWDSKPR